MRHSLKNLEPLIIILSLGLALPESTLADTGIPVCAQPTMSLVPVKASGPYTIIGNEIMIEPGAQVWLEIQICGWDPDLNGEPQIKTWQAQIDAIGYQSGLTGFLTTYAPDCTTDTECGNLVGTGSYCSDTWNYVDRCAPAFQDFEQDSACPAESSCLDLSISAVNIFGLVFGSTAFSGDQATDDGQTHYGGTAVFEVSADASGTFTIGFDQADSWLKDPANVRITPLIHVPALITIPGGCCLSGGHCMTLDLVSCEELSGTPVGPACQGDCNGNGIDDACDGFTDCNANGANDQCDIDTGFSEDCGENAIPDECDSDCNANGVPDDCDLTAGTSEDCDANGIPDECDRDCNDSGIPDRCDVINGTSHDQDGNGLPDECELNGCMIEDSDIILAPHPTESGLFGHSISVDKSLAVVGAPSLGDRSAGDLGPGAAYIFRFDGNRWGMEAKLMANVPQNDDHFGTAVALSDQTAVVGGISSRQEGRVFVFHRDEDGWSSGTQLFAFGDSVTPDSRFGTSVAVDGSVLIVGAPEAHGSDWYSGAAYIFRFNGSEWIGEAKIVGPNDEASDWFGLNVTASGNRVMVKSSIGVHIFRFDGSNWVQEDTLRPVFGYDGWYGVTMALEGDTALIGSRRYADSGTVDGVALIYRFNGASWELETVLSDPNTRPGSDFGKAVALEGKRALISDSGSAYIFRFDGAEWTMRFELIALETGGAHRFGNFADLSGTNVLVGAELWDENWTDTGEVYAFSVYTGDCNSDGIMDACDPSPVAQSSVPIDGSIDVRQPSQPDGSEPAETQSVTIWFDKSAGNLLPEEFTVNAAGGIDLSIVDIVAEGNVAELHFDQPVPPGNRVRITHEPSCVDICFGTLPGDVNQDGYTSPQDILDLIDHLNGVVDPPFELHQCDVDRSGRCTAADILRVIDLLNGAGEYEPWLGRSLPDCPAGG